MSDSKPRNLWGRISEFVKNPTQDWSLTRHENALRDLQEQEQVKAKEEQRKLDAFIRRRELASLRRLRKRHADGLPIDDAYTDVPDTGTGPSAPEREATVRKINEIEKSMVQETGQQAAGGKGRPSTLGTEIRTGTGNAMHRAADSGAQAEFNAQPVIDPGYSFQPTDHLSRRMPPPAPSPAAPGEVIEATVPAPTQMAPTLMAPTMMGMTQLAADHPPMDTWMKTGGSYGSANTMAVDVQEAVSSSPLFDQACIDFANGHDREAEKALLDAISGSPERELENEFWLALFDLYRASGDSPKFEALVNDYVDRFQSSAPSWDTPQQQPQPTERASAQPAVPTPAAPGAAAGKSSNFTALGELDAAQSRALLLLARGGSRQVTLEFSGLTGMAAGAQTFTLDAFKTLNASSGCAIELAGITSLIEACVAAAPPMQRDADPAWWGLRLEALRMAGEQEAYETAALDYCVTYEISPPTWEPSHAKVRVLAAGTADPSGGLSRPLSLTPQGNPSSEFPSLFNTHFGNTGSGVALARLQGDIKGGSEDFLKPLDKAVAGHGAVIVDLSALLRLDFASAGIMLNWVMSQSSAGRTVQFEGTHRLIAGLFVILGINSVAQIQLRKF
jgi:anti-anti-sigma regulatory factor